MKHIAIDPSGNWGKEGMGTTGICISEDGIVKSLKEIKASEYKSEDEYWMAHVTLLQEEFPDFVTIEGFKLYNHKGKEAKMQTNSTLQTPQIIGVLKHWCYSLDIPYNIQFASEVKTRWSEDVLVRLGILEEKKSGNKTYYYWKSKMVSTHKRDSLKHSLHWHRYKK